ncbi:MAG: hypothetical protein ACRBF0_03050 [Calditrichia bacterium]
MKNSTCIAILFLLITAACTDNPFSDNGALQSRNSIVGQVELPEGANGVRPYIWLDKINLGAFSDSSGRFSLKLPSPANQPGNGFSGSLTLYCYIGNYKIDTRQVLMNDGEFLYGQGDLNKNGGIVSALSPAKMLNVQTDVIPLIISPDVDEVIAVNMNLRAVSSPVRVSLTTADSTVFASAVAVRTDTTAFVSLPIQRGPTSPVSQLISANGVTLETQFTISQNSLSQGEYRILPSVWVEGTGVPANLLASLATEAAVFDAGYARIPFDRLGGTFSVSVSKDSTEAP